MTPRRHRLSFPVMHNVVPAGNPRHAGPARSARAGVCAALGSRATLKLFAEADHSFHVPARSGRTDAQVLGEVLDTLVAWIDDLLKR